MSSNPTIELSPIQQAASNAALRWETYLRQQTNVVFNGLEAELRLARSAARPVEEAAAALDACTEALHALGWQ